MIRWVSILLAGFITIQALHITPEDILKLDDLLEHARFHQETYGDDMYSFITKHYGSQQSDHMNTSHKDKHQDLPFQHAFTHMHCPVVLVTGILLPLYSPEITDHPEDLFIRSFQKKLFAIKTFQPPRNA